MHLIYGLLDLQFKTESISEMQDSPGISGIQRDSMKRRQAVNYEHLSPFMKRHIRGEFELSWQVLYDKNDEPCRVKDEDGDAPMRGLGGGTLAAVKKQMVRKRWKYRFGYYELIGNEIEK